MKQNMSFEVLTGQVTNYLQKLSYSESRISQYHSAWKRVARFMKEKKIEFFTANVGDYFICDLIGERSYDDIDRWEKGIIQCTNVLTEFIETGVVKHKRSQKFRNLKGDIGKTMQDYIVYRRSCGIAHSTIEEHKQRLYEFLVFLENNDIQNINLINHQILKNYANQLIFRTSHVRYRNLSVLKMYLRFLYDKEVTEKDFSQMVPKSKRVKQPKLPSIYSKEEVEALIKSIDRGSPKGKRDYAMVLLTARLGLRATDVCCLSFDHIIWDRSLIILNQNKTNSKIEFPLISEIGDAIIDYLKYDRPKSVLSYIFLKVNSPYDRLNRTTLSSIITFYLNRAGIQYKNIRKHGPHALRHSLVGVLLQNKVPLPVISEVLGHRNTESTRYYLRIDINSLRQCALEVPLVSQNFYERGGF